VLGVDQQTEQSDDKLPFRLGDPSRCGIVNDEEIRTKLLRQDDRFSFTSTHPTAESLDEGFVTNAAAQNPPGCCDL